MCRLEAEFFVGFGFEWALWLDADVGGVLGFGAFGEGLEGCLEGFGGGGGGAVWAVEACAEARFFEDGEPAPGFAVGVVGGAAEGGLEGGPGGCLEEVGVELVLGLFPLWCGLGLPVCGHVSTRLAYYACYFLPALHP